MRTICSSLVVLMLGAPRVLPAQAHNLGLTPEQRSALVRLVETDAEAGKQFAKLQREAAAASGESGHAVASLSTSGILASDPAKKQSVASLQDMKHATALTYANAIRPAASFSAAARRIILNWAEVNQPAGSPVDDTKLEPLIVAFDLLRDEFSAEEKSRVEGWLRKVADLETQNVRAGSVTQSNNWNSHRLKTVGLIGFALGDQARIDQAVAGFKKQIGDNLRPDGSSLDFHERDALHYHCYDLEPLLTLAIAARQNGIELFSLEAANGASLRKSLEFLVPYATGEKTHAEWVHSKVRFDHERSAAGERAFNEGANFIPTDARRVFLLASMLDPHYASLAQTLSKDPARTFTDWPSVLAKVISSTPAR